jgi:hypothetical protein
MRSREERQASLKERQAKLRQKHDDAVARIDDKTNDRLATIAKKRAPLQKTVQRGNEMRRNAALASAAGFVLTMDHDYGHLFVSVGVRLVPRVVLDGAHAEIVAGSLRKAPAVFVSLHKEFNVKVTGRDGFVLVGTARESNLTQVRQFIEWVNRHE